VKYEIKSVSGEVLWSGDADSIRGAAEKAVKARVNLSRANLYRANLYGANLSGADLSGADLYRANLYGANLSGADLSGADLYGANLYGVNLYRVIGLSPERSTPLLMLLDQPGSIRAYKLVTEKGVGPFNGGITYEAGKDYSEPNANTDPMEQCAAGLNVATLDWCLREWREGYRVLIVEFTAADIACIPHGTDGKFRLKRMRVVGEKDLTPMFEREKAEREAWEKAKR